MRPRPPSPAALGADSLFVSLIEDVVPSGVWRGGLQRTLGGFHRHRRRACRSREGPARAADGWSRRRAVVRGGWAREGRLGEGGARSKPGGLVDGPASATEAARPLLVGPDRAEEVDLPEGWPVGLAEVELAV